MDDPRVWARGRTYAEVLEMGGQMFGALEQIARSGVPPAPQPPSSPPQNQPANPSVDPNQYVTMGDLQQMLEQVGPSFVAPHVQPAVDMAASTNMALIQRDCEDDFRRWGPEIMQTVIKTRERMGPQALTLDNLKEIVKYVRSGHVDELVRERAEQLVTERLSAPTLRSDGASPGMASMSYARDGSPSVLQSEKIPAEYRARMRAAGWTDRTLNEYFATTGESPESFVKMFEKNQVISEVVRGD